MAIPAQVQAQGDRADELLKKAHERGVHSLTEREKKIINKSAREGQGR